MKITQPKLKPVYGRRLLPTDVRPAHANQLGQTQCGNAALGPSYQVGGGKSLHQRHMGVMKYRAGRRRDPGLATGALAHGASRQKIRLAMSAPRTQKTIRITLRSDRFYAGALDIKARYIFCH
jgi:hypothetical protein